MVNKRIILILLTITISTNYILAFDIEFAHPTLTEEIVKYYNHFAERKITQEELELIKLGSIQEDKSPRWVNHFYNPFTNSGINWNTFTGNKFLLSAFLASLPYEPLSSPNWAKNEFAQEKYQLNRTYQFAIRSYFENRKEAFIALGHLLHLIEDLGVPEHARGDSHAGVLGDKKSNYEEYAKAIISTQKLNFADQLIKNNVHPYHFKDLESIFSSLSNFTASNWFSEDTIGMYDRPKITRYEIVDSKSILYYSNNIPILLKTEITKQEKKEIIKTTNNINILDAWFNTIVPEIIKHGAALLSLYFLEINEIERNDVLLMNYQFERRQVGILNFFASLLF